MTTAADLYGRAWEVRDERGRIMASWWSKDGRYPLWDLGTKLGLGTGWREREVNPGVLGILDPPATGYR